MKKPLHMIKSISMKKLSEYQDEYLELEIHNPQSERFSELETLFFKIDMGLILISE